MYFLSFPRQKYIVDLYQKRLPENVSPKSTFEMKMRLLMTRVDINLFIFVVHEIATCM